MLSNAQFAPSVAVAAPKRKWLQRIIAHPLTLLLLAYICNTLLWSLITPTGRAPDESAHFDYVRYLALRGSIPIYGVTRSLYDHNAFNPEAMQPPLYYLLGTPIFLLLRNQPLEWQITGLRIYSVLLGAITVALAYRLGRRLAPERPAFALAVGALVGFNPMFTYMSAAVTNDNLINLIYAALPLLFWQAIDAARVSRGWLVGLGVLLGLGMLAKFSILTVIPVAGLLVLWFALREPQRVRALIGYAAWVGIPLLLVSGWLLVRNWQLYGDPTTLTILSRFPGIYPARAYREAGTFWEMMTTERPYLGFSGDRSCTASGVFSIIIRSGWHGASISCSICCGRSV